jgi:tetratricopeptide (TPR) repeat protein
MRASNLSETELLIGNVADAVKSAKTSVDHAERILSDRTDGDFWKIVTMTTLADSLHAGGACRQAERIFADAESRSRPFLYSVQGYQYCDLLLAEGRSAAALKRASVAIFVARKNNWLLDVALDTLIIARANFSMALVDISSRRRLISGRKRACWAYTAITEAIEGLRMAGQVDDLPRGLLARAAFWRSIGDWDGAARDLDEVVEIAQPGPMRLFLCDSALERARLAFARLEAFAPLNGIIEGSPSRLKAPANAERKRFLDEGVKQLAIAAGYVKDCGYHRRDEELAELRSVQRGVRIFASLPPRV